jgi:hypothetical protein
LRTVWNSLAQNAPSNPRRPICDLESSVYGPADPASLWKLCQTSECRWLTYGDSDRRRLVVCRSGPEKRWPITLASHVSTQVRLRESMNGTGSPRARTVRISATESPRDLFVIVTPPLAGRQPRATRRR